MLLKVLGGKRDDAGSNVDIKIPRVTNRQINQANHKTLPLTKKKFFPIGESRPYIHTNIRPFILSDLKERFSNDSMVCYQLNVLLPVKLDFIPDLKALRKNIDPLCKKFSSLLIQNPDTALKINKLVVL